MTVAEFKKWLDEKLPNDKYGDYRIEYIDFHNAPGEWSGRENTYVDGLYVSDETESVHII